MMKQTIIYTMLLTGLLAGLFYVGGTILAIGLGATGLAAIIFISFAIGSKWTHAMMRAGAEIAIMSAGQNDGHDATKIKAMAALAQEIAKARNQGQQPRAALPPSQQYPVLPPASFIDGNFTISGLGDEPDKLYGGDGDQDD